MSYSGLSGGVLGDWAAMQALMNQAQSAQGNQSVAKLQSPTMPYLATGGGSQQQQQQGGLLGKMMKDLPMVKSALQSSGLLAGGTGDVAGGAFSFSPIGGNGSWLGDMFGGAGGASAGDAAAGLGGAALGDAAFSGAADAAAAGGMADVIDAALPYVALMFGA